MALGGESLQVNSFLASCALLFATVLVLPFASAAAVFQAPLPRLVRSVPIALRMAWSELLPGHPSKAVVEKWKTERAIRRRRKATDATSTETDQAAWENKLLELPPGAEEQDGPPVDARTNRGFKKFDPIQLLDALCFCRHLRSLWDFSDALDDAWGYGNGDDLDKPRDKSKDPKRSLLLRSQGRVDTISMLMSRRYFEADRLLDLIRAICIYTDSSPVTGAELQGMIIDIWK